MGTAVLATGIVAFQSQGDVGSVQSAEVAERTGTASASRGGDRSPFYAAALANPGMADQETTTTVAPPPTTTTTAQPAAATNGSRVQSGIASYYDHKPGGCAHKTLPKGTVVTVTNISNGKSTTCVVNDRGPFLPGRIIDLETRVFKQVSTTSAGVFRARISW